MFLLLLLCLPLHCAERICLSPGIDNFQLYMEELYEIEKEYPYNCPSEYKENNPYSFEEETLFDFDTDIKE